VRVSFNSFILANIITDINKYTIKDFKISVDDINWTDNLQFKINEIPQIIEDNITITIV
jgi:hypothetical protein